MATSTKVTKKEAVELASEYGLPKVSAVSPTREASVNTHYLVETTRGKFVVKIETNVHLLLKNFAGMGIQNSTMVRDISDGS